MLAKLEQNPITFQQTNLRAIAQARLMVAKSTDLHDIVLRHAKDQNISIQRAKEEMLELLKYLTLCSINPGRYGMAGPIDHAWHCFILFTQKYGAFCELVGGSFIHHRPNTVRADYRVAANSYADFIDDYIIAFGEPDSDYWPTKDAITDCDDCVTCGHDCLTS